jgi:hypothetical protein
MSDDQTRQITQPIYYDDGKVIHACESAIMDRGVRLVWTKCDMDVPDDQSFTVEGEAPAITCRSAWRRQRTTPTVTVIQAPRSKRPGFCASKRRGARLRIAPAVFRASLLVKHSASPMRREVRLALPLAMSLAMLIYFNEAEKGDHFAAWE